MNIPDSLFGSMFDSRSKDPASPPEESPAFAWDKDSAKRALDELFHLTFQYKTSKAFNDLLKFVVRFRAYSPFNAMLVHIQMPGAKFVAPPNRWYRVYQRRIKTGARPLVILQPMGPVMFVFDVSDVDPVDGAPPLPPEIEKPFEVRGGEVGTCLGQAIANAIRDGIRIIESRDGSLSAGSIRSVAKGVMATQYFQTGLDKERKPVFEDIPVKYDLLVNSKQSPEARFATIVHELAHLYCGHLGTPDNKWWPDRRGLNISASEFEAESVSYLVCVRAGIDTPSERYLSLYLEKQSEVPHISLDCVMKAAGLIEEMSRQRLKKRKSSGTDEAK